jgi:hypothetical protein
MKREEMYIELWRGGLLKDIERDGWRALNGF